MGKTYKTFGERAMEKIPQYGNYGGPNYGHGEWSILSMENYLMTKLIGLKGGIGNEIRHDEDR